MAYAGLPEDGSLGVLGLGPVGQFAGRIARHLGHRVVAVDTVPERRLLAERYGMNVLDLTDDVLTRLRDPRNGGGPDSIVDAVGLEEHGSPAAASPRRPWACCPTRWRRRYWTLPG